MSDQKTVSADGVPKIVEYTTFKLPRDLAHDLMIDEREVIEVMNEIFETKFFNDK